MTVLRSGMLAFAVSALVATAPVGYALADGGGHVKETIKHAKEGVEHEKEAIKHLAFLQEHFPNIYARCLELGIVNEVFHDDQLLEQANKLVASLAAGAAGSQAAVKRLCEAAGSNTLAQHLAAERNALVANAGTADAREGVAAFMQKRPARFGQS